MRVTRTAKSAAERVDPSYVRRSVRGRVIMIGASFLLIGAVIVWWRVSASRNAVFYSPGPLSHVHALWNTNCEQCHERDAKGGFSHAVSDVACLKCHDAAVHDPHQATMVTQRAEPQTGKRSSDCTFCHQEHRGRDQLVVRDEQSCLSCHRAIGKFTATQPHIQPAVTRFALAKHPAFGRELTASPQLTAQSQALRDPTPLRFTHQKHMQRSLPGNGPALTCASCHTPDGRYMQPVSFERHCMSCHRPAVLLGAELPVPHVRLDLLRPLLREYANRESQMREVLAEMPLDAQNAALSETKKVVGPPPLRKVRTVIVTRTAEEWAAHQARPFWDGLMRWYADEGNHLQGIEETRAAINRERKKAGDLNEGKAADKKIDPEIPPELRQERAIEFYVAHSKDDHESYKCSLCHSLSDDRDALKFLQANAGTPMAGDVVSAYRSTTQPAAVETLPTGIGAGPRRWFPHSVFDHNAHRALECLSCHAQAQTSNNMAEVMLPKLEDCVICHRPGDATGPGAGDGCMTCHVFHDRTLEVPRLGRPVAALLERGIIAEVNYPARWGRGTFQSVKTVPISGVRRIARELHVGEVNVAQSLVEKSLGGSDVERTETYAGQGS